MNAIETHSLSKEYVSGWIRQTRLLALDGLDLKVAPGRIFGFLGPNGAGKSTTIKLLLGFISPSRGSGSMFGLPIHDKRARERVGFLPEDPSFCSYLRADEFLELCSRILHMSRPDSRRRIPETLALVGLAERERTRLSEFSKGMLQRIGLAQALLNNPDMLVLDEPLNGLDPHGRKDLKDILAKQKREGKTVFFSSHILSDVQEMCDEVGILNRGQLIASGTLAELLPSRRVCLRVEHLASDTLARIAPMTTAIRREEHGWSVELTSPDQKETVLAILGAEANSRTQVSVVSESLDDFFFRHIAENNSARGLTPAAAQD
jgi:ABC-2 type transport system ATP-binding protein